MSRVETSCSNHNFLFAQKKDQPPGLWDPLAGLFKKKVVPIEPIAPLPVEVPAANVPANTEASTAIATTPLPVEVPATNVPATPEVPAPQIPSAPEPIPEIPLPPSAILDQVEILPAIGVEQEIQNIALDSIGTTPITTELPIAAAVTVVAPIKNPSTLPMSFSRKAYGMLTLRNFTYLAILATAIAFIYLFYTRVWQKKPIPQKEPAPPLEEEKNLTVVVNLPQPTAPLPVVNEEKPKYQWQKPSDGIIGGIVGGLLGFFLSKFTGRRDSQNFQEELFRQADLKYSQLNAQFVTQSDLRGNDDFARAIAADPQLMQAVQNAISPRIDQIQQTIDQLKESGQRNRDVVALSDLEALQTQLSELKKNGNPEQFQKLGEATARLENRLSFLESDTRLQVQELLKKLKLEVETQISQNRDSIITLLRGEIRTMQESEGSKNATLVSQLQQIETQIGKLSGKMEDFEAQRLLEKLEEVKRASTQEKEQAIALLKQELAVQIQQTIHQIRSEFQKLNIENSQEIAALAFLVERNYELGLFKFNEVKEIIEALRMQDKTSITKALNEQSARIDALELQIKESISKHIQEMFDQLKKSIEERFSKLNGQHSTEVEELRAKMPQVMTLASIEQFESILARIALLETKGNQTSHDTNLHIVEMKAILKQSLELQDQLESMQRFSQSSLEDEVRKLLGLMRSERMLVLNQMSALENRVRDANAAIAQLRTDQNNIQSAQRGLDSRFMRFLPVVSPEQSPNRLTTAAASNGNGSPSLDRSSISMTYNAATSATSTRSTPPGTSISARVSNYKKENNLNSITGERYVIAIPELLQYLRGRGIDLAKYDVKKFGLNGLDMRTDKLNLLIEDYLNAGVVTTRARGDGNTDWTRTVGLHPGAVDNIANRSPTKSLDGTVTPSRRRFSIASRES